MPNDDILAEAQQLLADTERGELVRISKIAMAALIDELDRARARVAELEQQAEPRPGFPMAVADFDDWLRKGHRGLSSEAMVYALTGAVVLPGKPVHVGHSCPADAGDFGRCEALLRAVPQARDHLDRVAALGPVWAALVEHWGELVYISEGFDSRALHSRIQELSRTAIGHGEPEVSDRG